MVTESSGRSWQKNGSAPFYEYYIGPIEPDILSAAR